MKRCLQLVLTRELVAAFSGNELVFGVSLASWLVLTGAGAWMGQFVDPRRKLSSEIASKKVGLALRAGLGFGGVSPAELRAARRAAPTIQQAVSTARETLTTVLAGGLDQQTRGKAPECLFSSILRILTAGSAPTQPTLPFEFVELAVVRSVDEPRFMRGHATVRRSIATISNCDALSLIRN